MNDKKLNSDVEFSDNDLHEQISEDLYRNHESVDVKEKGDGYVILTEKRIGKKYKFIEKVTSIYKQNEDVQLIELLLSIKEDITVIIDDCFSGGYIADNTVESFGQAFYLYRNTIVHGNSDDKFIIKTPSNVGSPDESFWSGVAERIAEILIKKYCL